MPDSGQNLPLDPSHRAPHAGAGGGRHFEKGNQIGDFKLIRELGHGGMGAVWEAEQLSLKRRVALKLLKPQLSMSPTALQRFQREAEAGGRLQHPGIVQTYGVGEENGVHWIAQELIPTGFTLADALAVQRKQRELPGTWYRQTAEMFATLAEALEVAHQAGVIHRDIKPGNILIAEDDQPKVADFGLAQVQDDFALSRTGEFMGTPFYMSPEQAMSKRMGLDHRSDVFSLGATLYETLTLVRAFDGDTSQQVFHKIVTEEPPDPQKLRSRIPRDLAVICGKCLEKSPDRRYSSMAELATDLRRYLNHAPILARPPSPLARAAKWCRRHPVLAGSGGVAVVALVAITGLWRRAVTAEIATLEALGQVKSEQLATQTERDRARIALRQAEQSSYAANISAAALALGNGNISEARARLDACPSELRGWEWGHLNMSVDPSLLTIELTEASWTSLAWCPDGTRLVADVGSTAQVFDATTGTSLLSLDPANLGPASPRVTSCAWNPDGVTLATGSRNGIVHIWNGFTGQLLATMNGHQRSVDSVAWSPDGMLLVSGSGDHSLRIWEVSSGDWIKVVEGHEKGVTSVAWSPDGEYLLSGSMDHSVRIWNAVSGEIVHILKGHQAGVMSIVWSPDGTQFASASIDGTLRVWETSSGLIHQVLEGHQGSVYSVAWSPDGTHLVSGSADSTLRLWDVATGSCQRVFQGHESSVRSTAWSPDGMRLASSSGDRTIRIWDASRGATRPSPNDSRFRASGIALSPDGAQVILGWDGHSGGNPMTIADVATKSPLRYLWAQKSWASGIAWNPDGVRFVSGVNSGDGELELWDSAQGIRLVDFEGHKGFVRSISWSPDGLQLVSGSEDNTLRVWDATTGACLRTVKLEPSVSSVAWSPDGTRLASGEGQVVHVRNASTGGILQALEGHEGGFVTTVAWSPDGTKLASGSRDKTVRIWDSATAECTTVLRGHIGSVTSVSWNPDGTRLVSGSDDRTLHIWDTFNGTSLLTLEWNGHAVNSVWWSPDGKWLLSGSEDRTLRIWESDLEMARQKWLDAEYRWRVRPQIMALFEEHLFLDPVLRTLEADHSLTPGVREAAIELAHSVGQDPQRLNSLAWPLVDPDRRQRDSDVELGLRLAREASLGDPGNYSTQDTLAWALFANGFHDEALQIADRVIRLSPDSQKKDAKQVVDRMKRLISEVQSEDHD